MFHKLQESDFFPHEKPIDYRPLCALCGRLRQLKQVQPTAWPLGKFLAFFSHSLLRWCSCTLAFFSCLRRPLQEVEMNSSSYLGRCECCTVRCSIATCLRLPVRE